MIYDGLDYGELINGNWSLEAIGGCYGLYDLNDNKLKGFTVLNYGKNAETWHERDIGMHCLVAINKEIFVVLLQSVINLAKERNCRRITATLHRKNQGI